MATEPATPDLETQIASLQASGATVLALFVAPTTASQSYAIANRLGWRPLIVTGAASKVEGAVSIAFLKDPADVAWRDDPAIRLYRTIMSRYAKGAKVKDANHLYGMAVAYETVKVLKAAGATPTRAAVGAQMRKLNDSSNPFLVPGIAIRTTATDASRSSRHCCSAGQGGRWKSFGGLWG